MGDLLADRPQQQLGEATMTTRADDEQVGIVRLVHEHARRSPLHQTPLDLDRVGVGERLAQGLFERLPGCLAHLAEVRADRRVEALGAGGPNSAVLPGVYNAQPGMTKLRFLESEAQRLLRPLGLIDPDDDHVHGFVHHLSGSA